MNWRCLSAGGGHQFHRAPWDLNLSPAPNSDWAMDLGFGLELGSVTELQNLLPRVLLDWGKIKKGRTMFQKQLSVALAYYIHAKNSTHFWIGAYIWGISDD